MQELRLTDMGSALAVELDAVRDEARPMYPFGCLAPAQYVNWTLGNDVLLVVGGYWHPGHVLMFNGTLSGAVDAVVVAMQNTATGPLEIYEAVRQCIKLGYIDVTYPGDERACAPLFGALLLLGRRMDEVLLLKKYGSLTANQLAEYSGVTYPTAHRVLSDLLQCGIAARDEQSEVTRAQSYRIMRGGIEAVLSATKDFFSGGEL